MITFDDGYYNNLYYGLEVLKKYNLPPIQVEKLLDEPELTAKIDELKAKESDADSNNN